MPAKYNIFVNYQDTDAGGVVHHARYIEFAERARAQAFRSNPSIDISISEFIWAVINIEAQYKFPAKLNDCIEIITSFSKTIGPRLIINQKMYSAGILCVNMDLALVMLNSSNMKPVRLCSATVLNIQRSLM